MLIGASACTLRVRDGCRPRPRRAGQRVKGWPPRGGSTERVHGRRGACHKFLCPNRVCLEKSAVDPPFAFGMPSPPATPPAPPPTRRVPPRVHPPPPPGHHVGVGRQATGPHRAPLPLRLLHGHQPPPAHPLHVRRLRLAPTAFPRAAAAFGMVAARNALAENAE